MKKLFEKNVITNDVSIITKNKMEKAYLITQNTNLDNDFNDYQRFYIWDQYCEHNMFYFFDDKNFIKQIIKSWKKITITTPIISEPWLIKFNTFLKNFIILNDNKKIEIIINDYWLLNLINRDFPQIEIIWWNFLSWQNKDPYLKVFKDKEEHKKLSIDSSYYKKLFENKNIKTIELYNVFQWIDVQNNFNINIYYPYVVYSINRYCVNALINQNKKYLEIVENCNGCKGLENKDLSMSLKIDNENVNQYFRWNKQFYKNNILIDNKKIKRVIYNYDLLENNDW